MNGEVTTHRTRTLREMLSRLQDEARQSTAMEEEELRCADEALARLDAGKYGQCQNCGDAISIERLTAIPFASYCVDCQRTRNRLRGGWGHAPCDDQWTSGLGSGCFGAVGNPNH
jgi:RNA polymerase-binding transcription factor DksA